MKTKEELEKSIKDTITEYKEIIFATCLKVTKLIVNEQDVAVRTCKKVEYTPSKCMKTKEELEEAIKDTIIGYKEIIFGADSPRLYGAPG